MLLKCQVICQPRNFEAAFIHYKFKGIYNTDFEWKAEIFKFNCGICKSVHVFKWGLQLLLQGYSCNFESLYLQARLYSHMYMQNTHVKTTSVHFVLNALGQFIVNLLFALQCK